MNSREKTPPRARHCSFPLEVSKDTVRLLLGMRHVSGVLTLRNGSWECERARDGAGDARESAPSDARDAGVAHVRCPARSWSSRREKRMARWQRTWGATPRGARRGRASPFAVLKLCSHREWGR